MTEETYIPSDIYLDTSTLVAAIVTGSDDSRSASQYCKRLVEAETNVYFSKIVRLEVSQAILRIATSAIRLPKETRDRHRLDRWDFDFLVRHQWMEHGIREFERIRSDFAHVYEYPFDDEIWRRSIYIMSHYRLRSLDAIHVATAQQLGTRYFATSDADFRRIDDLNVLLIRD